MKRSKEMEKAYRNMLKDLDAMFGEANAGLLLAILLKSIKKAMGDKEEQNMRTLEITINDFFSAKWNFDKNDFVKGRFDI